MVDDDDDDDDDGVMMTMDVVCLFCCVLWQQSQHVDSCAISLEDPPALALPHVNACMYCP